MFFRNSRYVNRSGRYGSLLSILADAKTQKSASASNVLTGILYLAPARNLQAAVLAGAYAMESDLDVSRLPDVCPFATSGCRAACLYTAGRGRMSNVAAGRLRKTEAYHADRGGFIATLAREIAALESKAARKGMRAAVRLNGTSDIAWESVASDLFATFPNVQFYDYTKSKTRAARWAAGELPRNYHLTYSVSELPDSLAFARDYVARGGVAAVVVAGGIRAALATVGSALASDGDASDARFMDSATFAVLSPKGDAKTDASGFVYQAADLTAGKGS